PSVVPAAVVIPVPVAAPVGDAAVPLAPLGGDRADRSPAARPGPEGLDLHALGSCRPRSRHPGGQEPEGQPQAHDRLHTTVLASHGLHHGPPSSGRLDARGGDGYSGSGTTGGRPYNGTGRFRMRAGDPSVPAPPLYTCPMHPEVVRSAPGACPICGMALE